jgi:hypothetical protein
MTGDSTTMMLKIACPCGHVGLADASILPRDIVCSHCGASRRIERKDGARIVNRVAFEEWLRGASGGPAGHRKKTVGVTPRTFANRCSVTAVGLRWPDSRALTYER